MVSKVASVAFLLFLVTTFAVDAQRDGRRRTNRRKPTTETLPPPDTEPEVEKSPQKLDSEIETFSKPDSIDSPEPEGLAATPVVKENASSGNQSGPPFILPRATRKPRPMPMRNNGSGRPRPTLPIFSRKNSGRMHKAERLDIKKTEDNGVDSTSTTTSKPSRGGSRRRNSGQSTSRNSDNSNKLPHKVDSPQPTVSTEAAPKKRFGGGSRRPSRGSRRITTAVPDSEKL